MPNLHRLLEEITFAYISGVLDDDEFILLYDVNRPTNIDFRYKEYENFSLEDYNDDEIYLQSIANFNFKYAIDRSMYSKAKILSAVRLRGRPAINCKFSINCKTCD